MSIETASSDQAMSFVIQLMINGTRLAITATKDIAALLFKASMLMSAKVQQKVDLTPGDVQMAALLKQCSQTGETIECYTMSMSDYKKFHKGDMNIFENSIAEKYGLKYHPMNIDKEHDRVTIAITSSQCSRFEQLMKDFRIDTVKKDGELSATELKINKDNAVDAFIATHDMKSSDGKTATMPDDINQWVIENVRDMKFTDFLDELYQKLTAMGVTTIINNGNIADNRIEKEVAENLKQPVSQEKAINEELSVEQAAQTTSSNLDNSQHSQTSELNQESNMDDVSNEQLPNMPIKDELDNDPRIVNGKELVKVDNDIVSNNPDDVIDEVKPSPVVGGEGLKNYLEANDIFEIGTDMNHEIPVDIDK